MGKAVEFKKFWNYTSVTGAHFQAAFLWKANSGGSFQTNLVEHADLKGKVSRRCLEYIRLFNLSAVPAIS